MIHLSELSKIVRLAEAGRRMVAAGARSRAAQWGGVGCYSTGTKLHKDALSSTDYTTLCLQLTILYTLNFLRG